MAKRQFFEPWVAEPARSGIPDVLPDIDDQDELARLRDARDRAVKGAGWVVWGSGMVAPASATSLLGNRAEFSDKHVIVVVHNPVCPDGKTKAEDVARRIAACVSACAGIDDPAAFVAEARELMRTKPRGKR